MLAALAVGVLAVTVAVVRAYWPAPTLQPVSTTLPGVALPATTVLPVVPPPPATLPSEADLMAIDPAALDRSVAAYAEWYASRYFTRSGSTPLSDPHLGIELVAAGGRFESYVESAHAIEVVALSAARRQVTVVVRSLATTDPAGGYVRQPDRAVELVVGVDDEGLTVEDLPRPVAVASPDGLLSTLEEVDRPDLVQAARSHLAQFGTPADSSFHVGMTEDGRTRVGLLVADEMGTPWPYAVWFAADGSRLP
jgi:hypothetical protein